jgi:hypothetical protein
VPRVAVFRHPCFLLFTLLLSCSSPRPTTSPALLNPAPTVLSSEHWSFEGADGLLLRTTHYRLFTTEPDPHLRLAMPELLERALSHYTTALTPTPLPIPDLKLDTFLLATRPQWESLTRQVMGDSAAPYLRIQRGGFASGGRALLFSIGHRDTLAIAAHEGWHQYTQRTFKHELPLWLEEGIATYMEGFIPDPVHPEFPLFRPWANPERFEQLATSHRAGRLMPLTQLLETSPASLLASDTDLALTYYAQAWALVHFLSDGPVAPPTSSGGSDEPGATGLSRLLHDAAAGRLRAAIDRRHGAGASHLLARERRGTEVFTTYFGDLDRADRAFGAFMRMVVDGSKDRIVAGFRPF